jgi:hypothetical protein
MVVRVVQWTVDVEDVDLMARFWSGALGYTVEKGEDGSAKLFHHPIGRPRRRPCGYRPPVRPSTARIAFTSTSCPTAARRPRCSGSSAWVPGQPTSAKLIDGDRDAR